MAVEPTQVEGPGPDARSTPDRGDEGRTLRLPEASEAEASGGHRGVEPTMHLLPGDGPSDEGPTDIAPATVASFVWSSDPAPTDARAARPANDSEPTANLPTDEDWTDSSRQRSGSRSPRQGSAASYDTVEASGQFYEGQVIFNRYIVQREIGRGGMGAVWLVKHKELNADRALKVIVARISYDSEARSRFRLEAQVMASFHHPNAVVVHDARLTESDVAYIDMEYVQGRALSDMLHRGVPMPVDWIARVLDQLCDVLQVAHRKQIVHRDLKPANLMLLDGYDEGREQLKVLDFGIAKILKDAEDTGAGPKTQTGVFLGTPFYASPEQADGRADTRSDIYSVGVILYEFLTGYRPFSGPGARVLVDVMTKPPPPFVEVNPDVSYPPGVEALVMRCLAKKPEDRPQAAREVAEQFREAAIARSAAVPAKVPLGGGVPQAPRASRNLRTILAAASVAAAAGALGWSLRPRPIDPPPKGSAGAEAPTASLPAGFAPAPKSDLDDLGRPTALVATGPAASLAMRFVLLPGRKFAMGEPSDPKSNPHEEAVGDFAIAETEVTNSQMRAYFLANRIKPPARFEAAIGLLKDRKVSEAEIDQHPAVGLPREMAEGFAKWVGAQLPTSAQWEFAARSGGLGDRLYAWPESFPPKRPLKANEGDVNLDNLDGRDTPTAAVRSYSKDRTNQGVFDMMGNVREWCRDADAGRPGYFVVRGGSYLSQADQYSNFRCESLDRDEALPDLGFRVVVEMPRPDRRPRAAGDLAGASPLARRGVRPEESR